MIKLNLSNPLNLLDYGAKYNKSQLYLGYVKSKGYVLIQENNETTLFNCINSDKDPLFLNVNWQNDMEEISQLNDILNDRLSYLPNEELPNTKIDIIGELLEDLSASYESYYYIKPKKIKNQRIKDFALNPVDQFNFYENYDGEPLNKEDYAETKTNINTTIEVALQKAVDIFNDNKHLSGYNKKDNISPVITESEFIKLFNSIISESFGNPLLNIKFGKGREKLNRIEAIDYLTEQFNIKGVYHNGKETLYYFNDKLNYFEKLTQETLKNLIISKLGIKLLKEDYNVFYNSLETNDKIHNNILVFNNILFDMDYMEELNYPICNYKREDYLAPGLIGYEDRNNNVQLIDYDMDLDYMELYNTDPNLDEITFVEKTLRQILIPKDNPNDLSMFQDFLQRLGSCILGKNKYKVITLYFAPGNNGKGILKLLMELIFNKGAYSLTPKTFEETFNLQSFTNRKVLLLDEIDKNDFKHMKPTLKRISSPEGRVEQRAMYSNENVVLNNFPNFFIFSNELINLKLDELALFDRLDFLKLPNTFVSERELNKTPNSYLKDRNTEVKIKEDVKGLSWLITASIQSFIHMENSHTEYILRQTTEQTMDILLNTDYLTKFIRLYTYEDESLIPSEFTTAEEIYQQFNQYMDMNGKILSENELSIKRKIGTTIKKVYDIPGKLKDSEMYYKQGNNIASYRIKLKSFEDVDQEFKYIYLINENVTDGDLIPISFSNDRQIVYNKIQNGINTINLLNKALPGLDNYKIVRDLLNLNLIIKTTETNLLMD